MENKNMRRIAHLILAHFDAHRNRNKWQFLWRITVEGLLVPSAILIAIQFAFNLRPHGALGAINSTSMLIGAIFLAPFIETILLQVLPIMVARHFGASYWVQILASVVLFAASNFLFGIEVGILTGVIGGFYLAFTYLHWQQESFNTALLMTFGAHAAHNLVVSMARMAFGM
jgi:hypothetical protein